MDHSLQSVSYNKTQVGSHVTLTINTDLSLNVVTYVGHTDAIWDISLSPENHQTNLLASASADGTIKIWDTQSNTNLLKSSWTFDGVLPEESRRDRGDILICIDYLNV